MMFTERIWGLEGRRDDVAANAEVDDPPPPADAREAPLCVAVEVAEGWKPYRLLLAVVEADVADEGW